MQNNSMFWFKSGNTITHEFEILRLSDEKL